MSDSWEPELAERMTRLKAEEAQHAPQFAETYRIVIRRSDGLRRARTRRWAVVATTLAAAALAGILLTAPDADAEFEALVASYSGALWGEHWRAPTDGLLNVPGMDLINTIPTIGGSFRLPVSGPADPSGNDV
jgi:hypothetical protein